MLEDEWLRWRILRYPCQVDVKSWCVPFPPSFVDSPKCCLFLFPYLILKFQLFFSPATSISFLMLRILSLSIIKVFIHLTATLGGWGTCRWRWCILPTSHPPHTHPRHTHPLRTHTHTHTHTPSSQTQPQIPSKALVRIWGEARMWISRQSCIISSSVSLTASSSV